MKIFYTVLILYSFLSPLQAQVGNQLPKNDWALKLEQAIIQSDSYFDSNEEKISIRTNSFYQTSLNGVYAFSDRIMVVASLPFFARATVNEIKFNQSGNSISGASLNSFGDAEFGASFSLRKKFPVQVSAYIKLGLPFGASKNAGTEDGVQTGDGEFNQMAGIQLMQVFSNFQLSGHIAYNNRTEDFSNEIRYGIDISYMYSNLQITARYRVIESLFDKEGAVALNGIFSNHRELFSPGAEIKYYVGSKFGVFASADFITAGRNTLHAPLWGVGILLKKSG